VTKSCLKLEVTLLRYTSLWLVSVVTDERQAALTHLGPGDDMSTSARFNEFMARVLEDPEARAAFEDAQSRSALVDALVRVRRRLGLTQSEVARRMGVKQPSISGFETEGSDPRVSTVQRYARAVDSDFIWDICPKAAPFHSPYRNPTRAVEPSPNVDVSHAEPTRRARSWTKSARRRYELAA
jgi:transcriptional regulator with XRE-family HTH domain